MSDFIFFDFIFGANLKNRNLYSLYFYFNNCVKIL